MADPLTLDGLKRLVSELSTQHLRDYTASLLRSQPAPKGKDVNDALWGTISLTRLEVVLLDSPLLQRLRYIRQLGAAHWVYPGAVHTRFEHLLGAMHLVRSMAAALNQAAKAADPDLEQPPISEATIQVLRLAVVLREAAQMAFSQVSEEALSDSPVFATIPKSLSEELRVQAVIPGEDVSFVQVVAYYLVQSHALRELLAVLLDREGSALRLKEQAADNLAEVVRQVSFAIIGRRINNKLPLVHELVVGPFDATGVDALMRDAKFSGLPTLLDEQRILQKLAAKKMPLGDMPPAILTAMEGDPRADAWLFGVKDSAAAVLDELQLARMLATAKVYQHSKVLAIEQMLRSVISSLVDASGAEPVLRLLFSTSDDALLGMSASRLIQELGVDAQADGGSAIQRVEAAALLLAALRERRLWVRAFQFPEWRSALDVGRDASEALEAMRDEFRHVERRVALMDAVRNEAQRILEILGQGGRGRPVLDALISARSLELTSSETEVGRAYVIRSSAAPYQFSQWLAARGSWLDQYNAGQPRDHIFCPSEIADVVFVAFERVARTRYQAKLPDSSAEASKRRSAKVLELKRALVPHHYWQDAPYDIRPLPPRLAQPDVDRRLRPFYGLHARYLEPIRDGGPGEEIAPDSQTRAWLRQFDNDNHIACALRLLSSVRMLDRRDVTRALEKLLEAMPEFRGGWVAPFGSPRDSGSMQAYFADDARPRGLISGLGSLEEYAAHGERRPLIFVDDFVGSGGQACDILAAWFGRDDFRRNLGEERAKLPQAQAEALSSARVAFLYVAGWNNGIDAVQGTCGELGLNATAFASLLDDDLPFARRVLEQDVDLTPDVVRNFLERCAEIGRQLVRTETRETPRREPLEERVVADRALGYGNRGMLLVTPFNTPTHTLTALWMDGQVDDLPWTPLLRRRKKT